MENIDSYYNKLAPDYDASRFNNSYGQFIHEQECEALVRMLNRSSSHDVLDLACGTGRMLDFAQTGCDLSPQMLAEAQKKHPSKTLILADASQLPFSAGVFEMVYSLHFFMHLDAQKTKAVLAEVHRVSKPGAYFAFDIPSQKRRGLTRGHHKRNWHGSNAASLASLQVLANNCGWQIIEYQGVLFFPIHLVPVFMRPYLRRLDSFFCRSFLKAYASYLFVILQKK
jgi:ubiquinone/menaquinone biosynthesis C-methylase UbiE